MVKKRKDVGEEALVRLLQDDRTRSIREVVQRLMTDGFDTMTESEHAWMELCAATAALGTAAARYERARKNYIRVTKG